MCLPNRGNSDLLGHSSAVTTLNIYAHLWPDADDRARAAVDAVFAGVP